MSTRSVLVFASADELAAFFTDKLIKAMASLKAGQYFSLLLSGGSTPRMVYEYLSRNQNSIPWQRLQLFWGDERCVPPDQDESNYKMVKNSLLDHVPIPSDNIFRIKGESDPQTEAVRYAETLSNRVPSKNGLPCFDLVMLGLGDDGHTASLFPNDTKNLFSEGLFEVAAHPESGQRRVTATLQLINNARTIVFLVTGKSKAGMLARILGKGGENYPASMWENYPAALVEAKNGEVIWLVDQDAAPGYKVSLTI
jgi:6-phosphogluconolactonase